MSGTISFLKNTSTAKNEPMCKLTFKIKSSLIKFINLEKFLNQNGIAILLGSDKTQLKFIGEIEAKAYGFKEKINIDFSLNNFKDIIR